MENQHRQIKGYRDLTADEISLMNDIKAMGEKVGDMVKNAREDDGADQRWVSIAQTHLQQGFMALVRSVAKPTSF